MRLLLWLSVLEIHLSIYLSLFVSGAELLLYANYQYDFQTLGVHTG